MDDSLEQLIDQVEQDEATHPTRDTLLENLYSALADLRLGNSWGETFIVNGIDAYVILRGFVAVRAASLDYHLEDYERRLEEGIRSPDRTFVGPTYRNEGQPPSATSRN